MLRTAALVVGLSAVIAAAAMAAGAHEHPARPAIADAAGTSFQWRAHAGTTIQIMLDSHPWQRFIEPLIPQFEKKTGVRVDLSVYPESQFRTKRTVEMLSGTSSIDGFMIMPAEDLDKYATHGWLEPLNALMSSRSTLSPSYALSDFFPSALKAGVRKGHNYAIPIQLETSLLAYNEQILARYHVGVPRTMDELLSAARTIYEDSHGKIYGITMRGDKAAATSQWIDFVHSYGGRWLDGSGKAAIDSPQAIAATELYGKLLRLYGPKSALTNSWYESTSIFMHGRAAMIYDANVFKAEYENRAISSVAGHVGYAVIPKGPAGSVPHVSAWSLAIYSGSHHRDATWLFIQWATSRAIDLEALIDGIPIARSSAWNSPTFKQEDTSPEWTRATLASYKSATPRWNPPVSSVSQCRAVAGGAILAAILGLDIPTALEQANKQMNAIITGS